MVHSLGTWIVVAVFVVPIESPHEEKLEQDRIGELLGRTSMDLFGDTTGVSPQAVVPMAFGQDIIVPTIVVRPLLSRQRQTTSHMTRDLEGRSVPSHCNENRLLPPHRSLGTVSARFFEPF